MSNVTSTIQNDLASFIHPNTNLAQHQEIGPLVIAGGDGVRVFDEQDNAYIEAMSGLWRVALGFSEKRLVDAAVEQFRQLPYCKANAWRSRIDHSARLRRSSPRALTCATALKPRWLQARPWLKTAPGKARARARGGRRSDGARRSG